MWGQSFVLSILYLHLSIVWASIRDLKQEEAVKKTLKFNQPRFQLNRNFPVGRRVFLTSSSCLRSLLLIRSRHEDVILTRKSHNCAGTAFVQGDPTGGSKLIEQTLQTASYFWLCLSIFKQIVSKNGVLKNPFVKPDLLFYYISKNILQKRIFVPIVCSHVRCILTIT